MTGFFGKEWHLHVKILVAGISLGALSVTLLAIMWAGAFVSSVARVC